MKQRVDKPFPFAFLCGLLVATACMASTTYASPTADVPAGKEKHLGIAGFPALEVFPDQEKQIASVVAREVPLQEGLSYSSGYFSPLQTFVPPTFFSFTIYGYHDKPEWKDIQAIQFKYGKQTFKGKPLYIVAGPDRDKTLDTQKSNYFETLIVQLPPAVARQIVANNGVLLTTDPDSFHVLVPASKLDRFKQVVNSVAAIAGRAKANKPPAKTARPKSA